MKNRKNTIKTAITTALAALTTLLFLSCSQEGALMKVGTPSSDFLSEEVPALSVRVAEVVMGDLESHIVLSGEISATGEVNVMPETNGLLTRILVAPGDFVVEDQVIAYVDPSRPGMSYAESPVRARSAGTVTSVPAIAGNQVSAQTVVAQVGNLDRLEAIVRVPEKYLAWLELGMKGTIVSRSFPDLDQLSSVVEISPVVDPRSRTIEVTMSPDSTDKLRPGQAVSINLILETRSDALIIPESALTERQDGKGVFVLDGESVEWRQVDVGTTREGRIEVTGGLSVGEPVVIAGIGDITDGSTVRVIES